MMKKGLFILSLLFGLALVSCSKQEINPDSNIMRDIPQWNSSTEKSGGSGIDMGDDGEDDPIVDPNNPDDGLKKP